jgi:hypothetical protein
MTNSKRNRHNQILGHAHIVRQEASKKDIDQHHKSQGNRGKTSHSSIIPGLVQLVYEAVFRVDVGGMIVSSSTAADGPDETAARTICAAVSEGRGTPDTE